MPLRSQPNYYELLGVAADAATAEILSAYRRLARRFHPNLNPGDPAAERRYLELSEAYAILSDSRKRAFFDRHGFYDPKAEEESRANEEASVQKKSSAEVVFEGFDLSEINRSFGDVIDQILGTANPETSLDTRPQRGEDLEFPLSVSFEDALRGRDFTISLSRQQPCGACGATGFTNEPAVPCPTCEGTGKRLIVRGGMRLSSTCEECHGLGRRIPVCPTCGGPASGARIWSNASIPVRIPPGVDSGSRIRIPAEGHAGPFGGPPGDLYVVTNVGGHRFFTRKGENLYCKVPIRMTEAVLGAHIEVPTLDGPTTLRVPPGSQPGQVFRLREKGFPSLRGDMRGDQYVELKVVIPRVADPRSRALIEEFGNLNPDDPRASSDDSEEAPNS